MAAEAEPILNVAAYLHALEVAKYIFKNLTYKCKW